jgi:hypothetical protein
MTPAGTLPGIAFEAVPRSEEETLPRMDAAGFVGFAARGPIDIPVLVEDPVTFRDVFGPDPELARNDDGTRVRGHLGAAVEAFYANGGRRAWVVRVAATGAGGAVTNRFVVPGLFLPGSAAEGARGWRAVTLLARSPGAWSDALTVGVALEVTTTLPMAVDSRSVVLDHATDVVAGDLLRVLLAEDLALMVEVQDVVPHPLGRVVAFDPRAGHLLIRQSPASNARAYLLGDGPPESVPSFTTEIVAGESLVVVAAGEILDAGDVLLTESRSADGVTVVALGQEQPHVAAPGTRRFAIDSSVRVAAGPDDSASRGDPRSKPVVVEIQRLRLTVRDGDAVVAELSSLGIGRSHPRPLVGLPDDDRVYTALGGIQAFGDEVNEPAALLDRALTPFERECLAPRFPLAGPAGAPSVLPLGATTDPAAVVFGGRPSAPAYPNVPTRNGLDRFDAALFVDPSLAGLGVDTILPTASELVHLRRPSRRLRGIHALATLDDVTLVCVPDAVHTGWDHIRIADPLPPLTPPELEVDAVDEAGVHLAWSQVPTATRYWVEAGLDENFSDPTRSADVAPAAVVAARSACPAPHFFRVRAVRGPEEGPWSNVVVAVAPPSTFVQCLGPTVVASAPAKVLAPPDTFVWRARTATEAEPWLTLRAIQSAVLRWCAARGDVVAVLGLPNSFTAEDAVRHVSVLRGDVPSFEMDGRQAASAFLEGGVPALTRDESYLLGYGALYHPWRIAGRPGDDLRAAPPDGAVLGTYAARAAERGAWVAPARIRLDGTLALLPPVDDRQLSALVAAGINPLVEDPSGFMAITASTLTDVAAVRPVNVRRLIALLRRLADREGVGIVFEPNDRELQRIVRMRFERFLTDMYLRGAFVGATPQEAFEVSTGDVVNPPHALDSGRFLVEVRIAPSRALEFITVRLVLTGGNATEGQA